MYISTNNACKHTCNTMSLTLSHAFDETTLNINHYYRKTVLWLKNKIFKGLHYQGLQRPQVFFSKYSFQPLFTSLIFKPIIE